jgi:hypothetical protein
MRISAKKLAETAYESKEVKEAFEHAWETWPEYNDGGEGTADAADYIFDIACDKAEEILGKSLRLVLLDDVKFGDAVRTELYESIYAGLT